MIPSRIRTVSMDTASPHLLPAVHLYVNVLPTVAAYRCTISLVQESQYLSLGFRKRNKYTSNSLSHILEKINSLNDTSAFMSLRNL